MMRQKRQMASKDMEKLKTSMKIQIMRDGIIVIVFFIIVICASSSSALFKILSVVLLLKADRQTEWDIVVVKSSYKKERS